MGISLNFSKLKHYEDCIDFEDKESELEKLKKLYSNLTNIYL